MDYATFSRDVAKHQLTIIKDDGLYRHLRFKRPQDICYQFDVITWPGYLAYVGDMGSYVFSRVPDMLKFFRNEPPRINLGYWAEKCQASGRHDGILQYSSERLLEAVNDYMEDWPEAVRAIAQEELIECLDLESEDIARREIGDWSHTTDDGLSYAFTDFWEYSADEFTNRFIWCCYALAWGIQQYDKMKGVNE